MRTAQSSTISIQRLVMLTVSLLIGGAVLWSGCDLVGTTESESGNSPTMSVLLTDAPAELIEKAEITIETIYLQGAGDDGRDTLLTETTDKINLLDLRDRTMELVKDDTISPGTYSQLRLVLGTVELTTAEGTYTTNSGPGAGAGSLICPSCSASGLKIKLPDGGFTVDEDGGSPSELILDFDVSQSFGHKAGRSGKWVMHPVITASRAEVSGSVEGTVGFASGVMLPDTCGTAEPSIEDFAPLLRSVETDSVVKSTMVNPDSTFTMRYVEPGMYSASYVDSADIGLQDTVLVFDATPSPAQPEVASGGTTSLDYEVSSATCTVVQ